MKKINFLMFSIITVALTLFINCDKAFADEEYTCIYGGRRHVTASMSITIYNDNGSYKLKDCCASGVGMLDISSCDFSNEDYFKDNGFKNVLDEYGKKGECPPNAFHHVSYKMSQGVRRTTGKYTGFGDIDFISEYIRKIKKGASVYYWEEVFQLEQQTDSNNGNQCSSSSSSNSSSSSSSSSSSNSNSSSNSTEGILYDKVSCGDIELPDGLVNLISIAITGLQIAVPIILVIMGMLDFAKATTAAKEDEIKKAQQSFVRRLIAGACVFFVIFVVKITVGLLNTDDSNQVLQCVDKILNGVEGGTKLSKEQQFEIKQDSLKNECETLYENGGNWKACICEVAVDIYNNKKDEFDELDEFDIPEYIRVGEYSDAFRPVFDTYAKLSTTYDVCTKMVR